MFNLYSFLISVPHYLEIHLEVIDTLCLKPKKYLVSQYAPTEEDSSLVGVYGVEGHLALEAGGQAITT